MTAPTNNASFYADFGSLAALKRDAKVDSQKTLRAAAQQFESLFTDMMLKSMRAASIGDSLTGSNDLDMYQGMFDQQLSVQLSKGKGIGLADMLVQQLTRSGLVPHTTNESSTQDAVPVGRVLNPTSSTVETSSPLNESANESGVKPDLQVQTEPTVISSADWPPATREEFVQRLLPHAQAAAQQLGVDPATLVAHAALETGWGKHMPCNADGSSSFNLFGIKAHAEANSSVSATTVEYEQGVAVKRVERFKAYDSPAECFSDYAKLLGGHRYATARNTNGNAAQFAQALQQSGYATDPQYASKLRSLVGAVRSIQVASAQVGSSQAGSIQAGSIQVSSTQADT